MRRAQEHRHAQLAYRHQDSAQSLAEGLEEYYAANAGRVVRPRDLPAESRDLFRSHDMCHVIFGLGTSIDDEALVDTRTLFSCDVGARRYAAYLAQDEQAKALFRELGYLRSLGATVLALPRLCRGVYEATKMKKRWPWEPPQAFQDRELSDLRREFGIRVI